MACKELLELAVRCDREATGDGSPGDAALRWMALLDREVPGCRFALLLADPVSGELETVLLDGRRRTWSGNRSDGDGVGRAFRTGEPAEVADLQKDGGTRSPLVKLLPRGQRSAGLFPLKSDDGVEGLLVAGHGWPAGLPPDLQLFLTDLALRMGRDIRQARSLAALTASCRTLERKCTLRMAALKKTVQKLETEIRERKRAEAALREKEEQFKAIADYTYDWESWVGGDGRLLWVNPAVERLTGYTREACFEMADYPLGLVVAADRERLADLLRKALADRTTGNDVAFRIARKDGREAWMAISWQPIYDDAGDFMGLRSSIRDISQRKTAEDSLRRSHERLEAEVARRTEKVRALQLRLQAENRFLKKELADTAVFGEIIGESPSIRAVVSRIGLVAPTQANVLILGESGTGKELVAREIHRHSLLKHRPFVRVNCATIPKDLYESEFFGHVKGAFTGAVRDRIGRFEAADGGTLFLDEVGEIPLDLQGKLLRVLQEGEFERVGEGRTRKATVRIIAATNKRIAEEVRRKRFREDLYYRLNVFPIEITPLRDRKEDLPLLAAHFLEHVAKRLNRPTPRLTRANVMDLLAYDWPGNVRELQNLIERALILAPSGRLRFDLPPADRGAALPETRQGQTEAGPPPAILTESDLRDLQKRSTLAALEQSRGRIYGDGGAADILGLKPTTLIARMRRMGIRKTAGSAA